MESPIQQMTMNPIMFQTTNWDHVPLTQSAGESGVAYYRTQTFAGFRVRIVEYSKGYKADHWCKSGHIVYCLEGEMVSELADGRKFVLSKGMSYTVSDDVSRHRSFSENGAKLMIIDGQFLKHKKESQFNPWKM
jgi:quercetin dioxygenase-like cupin family protein